MNKLEQEVFDLLEENKNYIEDIEEFEVIEEGDWIDEGKYSFLNTIIKYNDCYFEILLSRSGSYYTDYDYSEPEVFQVEPKEEVKVVTTWVRVKS